MSRARITRGPAAEDDLLDIWHFVAADSPRAADRLLDEIELQVERLADFPELGPRRPDISAVARSLVVGRYLVLYRFDGDTVEIVRIVHGARDLTELF